MCQRREPWPAPWDEEQHHEGDAGGHGGLVRLGRIASCVDRPECDNEAGEASQAEAVPMLRRQMRRTRPSSALSRSTPQTGNVSLLSATCRPIRSMPWPTSLGLAPAAALSYARARHAWSLQLARARAQHRAWSSAAFASFAVLALLVSSMGSNILGISVAAPVIEGAQLTETRDFAGADSERSKPPFMLDGPAEVVPASLALSRRSAAGRHGPRRWAAGARSAGAGR